LRLGVRHGGRLLRRWHRHDRDRRPCRPPRRRDAAPEPRLMTTVSPISPDRKDADMATEFVIAHEGHTVRRFYTATPPEQFAASTAEFPVGSATLCYTRQTAPIVPLVRMVGAS